MGFIALHSRILEPFMRLMGTSFFLILREPAKRTASGFATRRIRIARGIDRYLFVIENVECMATLSQSDARRDCFHLLVRGGEVFRSGAPGPQRQSFTSVRHEAYPIYLIRLPLVLRTAVLSSWGCAAAMAKMARQFAAKSPPKTRPTR